MPSPSSSSGKSEYAEKHLSQCDVFWLRNDVPENRMVINFCFTLEKNVEMAKVNDYMKRWIQMYPRFRSRTVKRGYSTYDWEPVPNFDPVGMGCVTQHRLKSGTQEELDGFVDHCVNDVFPADSFQWRLYKVDNVPWGGCLMIWRVHHCVCDGLALVHIIRSLFETDESAESSTGKVPEEAPRRRPRKTLIHKTLKLGKLIAPILVGVAIGYGLSLGLMNSVLLGVSLMVVAFWGRPLGQAFTFATGFRWPDTKTSLKAQLGGFKKTSVIYNMISLQQVRDIAANESSKDTHYTINDILCAMVGGAFRRWFEEQGYNPNKMIMRCVLPVNVRHPKEEFRCENRFTLIFARLPVHLEKAKQRIRQMHQVMEDLKNGFEPLTGVFFLYTLGLLPRSLMEKWVTYYCNRASVVVTNVDARKKPCRFCGVLMTDVIAWVPSAGGIGVGVSMISYMGKLNVGLIADTKQVPNLPSLAKCFRDEWNHMVKELMPGKSA